MSQTIATIGFGVIAAIILLFALVVLWKIYRGDIKIDDLLAESPPPGNTPVPVVIAPVDGVPPDSAPRAPTIATKASLSRFQFLLFTFVIAGLFLLLSIEAGTFVDIPQNVLILLGISGGSYVVSKTVGPAEKK
jgi:hypothetical protein